jgi:hypothetical protein
MLSFHRVEVTNRSDSRVGMHGGVSNTFQNRKKWKKNYGLHPNIPCSHFFFCTVSLITGHWNQRHIKTVFPDTLQELALSSGSYNSTTQESGLNRQADTPAQ